MLDSLFLTVNQWKLLADPGRYYPDLGGIGVLGVEKCSMSGGLLYKLNLKGKLGAFVLGLAYGILSGSCTFGFIAPRLAIITVCRLILDLLYVIPYFCGAIKLSSPMARCHTTTPFASIRLGLRLAKYIGIL